VRILRRLVDWIRPWRTESQIAIGGTSSDAQRWREELERQQSCR
jgi:hypothetical protein